MNADLFDEWLDAYLLDELSGEQAAQFRAALATDPAARERFVRRVYVEAHLHRLAGSEVAPPAPLPAAGRRWVLGRLARSRWVAVAAVLVIAIGGVIAFQMSRRNDGDARLTSGSVQTGGRAGDRIRDGETVRVTGPVPAVINLADGSTVTLDPDAQCVFRKGVRGARQV
ncbi:MAG: anti-sigma factor, partial [Phycisphaerae bacterium]